MKKYISICSFLLLYIAAYAQKDSVKIIQRIQVDTAKKQLNMDAVYARPFLSAGKMPVALGGYVEANTQYSETDGVSEGFSFQARRFTLFLSSTVGKKIKFLSELEFEDGTKEINLEFAALDLEFHPLFNFRGGIIMNPIGGFNQNHDGPRWEFVDRPFSATTLIPATFSNAGFGLHGKYFVNRWVLGYEVYLSNGLDDQIIANDMGRTSLAAGKNNVFRFEESNSGSPFVTGKLAIRQRKIGELGVSYLSGIYNLWRKEGLVVDVKRSVQIFALDFNTSFLKNRISLTAEAVKVWVQTPSNYEAAYGSQQWGGFVDIIGTVLNRKMLGWEKAKLNVGVRLEYLDYNDGVFVETGGKIGDEMWSVVPTVSFRPNGSTVLRLNYRIQQNTDLFGNPPANTAAIQVGFSSYF